MEYHTDVQKRLDQIYTLIEVGRQNPFDRNFDDSIFELVDSFLSKYEDTDYIQLILNSSEKVDIHKVGCLLTIMLWSTKDEGAKINAWRLDSFNNGKQRDVEIALCVTDVYPMKDLNAFLSILNKINEKYPKTGFLCEYWMVLTKNALLRDEIINKENLLQKIKQKIIEFFN